MVLRCKECGEQHDYGPEEFRWDFAGYGYDTKYVVCPACGQIEIIGYHVYDNFDVNRDERFYSYEEE